MAWWFRHKKQKAGRPIEARTLRQMAQTCDWASQIRANPPLSIMATGNGPLFRLASMLLSVYIGVVGSGGVTARSGSTPGSGSVTLQTWNGTSLANFPGSASVTAYNISASGSGIASGKYCIILKIAGAYFIITSEC